MKSSNLLFSLVLYIFISNSFTIAQDVTHCGNQVCTGNQCCLIRYLLPSVCTPYSNINEYCGCGCKKPYKCNKGTQKCSL